MKNYVMRGLIFIGIMVLCTAVIYLSVGIVQVNGMSMYPNFSHGEVLLYSRLHKEIAYGDIVIFKKDSSNYVKRVYGKPGDTVSISDSGVVLVNNSPLLINKLFLAGTTEAGDLKDKMILGKDEYFVLGDNRAASLDSRNHEIGTVLKEEIVGVYLLKIKNEPIDENRYLQIIER